MGTFKRSLASYSVFAFFLLGAASTHAASLVFSTQPGGASTALGWPQQPIVKILDANGALVSTSTANIRLKLVPVSGSGVLYGLDVNHQAVGGIASFSNLSVNGAGTYRLMASMDGAADVLSSVFTIQAPRGIIYYVSPNGNDANDGKSATKAWKSVDKVNASSFGAGDLVLFEGGKTFTGCLVVGSKMAATAAQPFVIGSYGSGKFRLKANCTKTESTYDVTHNRAAVDIRKITGFILQDCILEGNMDQVLAVSPKPAIPTYGAAYGVLFNNGGYNSGQTTSSVTIRRCDITGFYTTHNSDYGGNIFFNSQGPSSKISILNNNIYGSSKTAVQDNGIGGSGNANKGRLTDVVVQGNHVYNIGGRKGGLPGTLGNGIVMNGTRVLIQNNVVHDTGANTTTCGGSANIWAVSANYVTIQYNESYRSYPTDPTLAAGGPNAGGCDWDGFDLDLDVTNSVVQYNYSHDNYGAGYLAYVSGKWGPNTYRYNISLGDGHPKKGYGGFSIADWSNAPGTLYVYNNVFDGTSILGASVDIGGSKISGFVANNIFRPGASAGYSKFIKTNGGNPSGLKFVNNAYWSNLADKSKSYFNWVGCAPYNVCNGVSSWQNSTGQDSLALALSAPASAPVVLPSSNMTCGVAAITAAFDGKAISSCLGSTYKLVAGSAFKSQGLDLRKSPYLLNIGVRDFFGTYLPTSNAASFNMGYQQ